MGRLHHQRRPRLGRLRHHQPHHRPALRCHQRHQRPSRRRARPLGRNPVATHQARQPPAIPGPSPCGRDTAAAKPPPSSSLLTPRTKRIRSAWLTMPIACSATSLAEAVISTGFSYSSAQRARQAEVLRTVLPTVGDMRRPGSAAVSLCWVACGRLDAFFETGLQPWDFAAGALIALEAGADIQGAESDLPRGELIIASAPTVTAGLRQMLGRTHWTATRERA